MKKHHYLPANISYRWLRTWWPSSQRGPSLLNPSNIPSGNQNMIVGQTAATMWWGTGGLTTDTRSGSPATSTNGKDPCVALGPG